ncbi:MAG: hypothetical protein ACE5JX_20945 [Acidobacteriota bacterium]
MTAILDFISNNAFASTLISAAILAGIGGAWKRWHDRKDSETIYNFLLGSKSTTDYTFRSTEAISSHTKIPEERVAKLCGKHPKIRRSEKEKQSWTLVK